MAREPATLDEYTDVTLDLSTLTMGELAAAEVASGMSYGQMLRSRTALKLMAMFIHELRTSVQPRSWSELSNLRLLESSSSPQPSDSAETPAK